MNIPTEAVWTIGVLSGLIASLVTSGFQSFNAWRERDAAAKRHLRDLALKLALEQWQHEIAVEKASQTIIHPLPPLGKGDPIKIGQLKPARSLHQILFEAIRFSDAIAEGRVSDKNLTDFTPKTP